MERCWEFLTAPNQTWTSWWPSLIEIDVIRTADILGSTARCVWRSPLRHQLIFTLTLTGLIPQKRIELVSVGDLEGDGVVEFAAKGSGSELTINWRIHTTRPWMNMMAPLLRPAFTLGHHIVMRRGERGLNTTLN